MTDSGQFGGGAGQPAPGTASSGAAAGVLAGDADIRYLPGVGEKRAALLKKLGIFTVLDLLLHLPFRYDDRREVTPISALTPGAAATVRGRVIETRLTTTRRRMKIFEAAVEDSAGTGLGGVVRARWFNQAFRARQIVEGGEYLFFGKATHDRYGMSLVLENPDFEPWDASEETMHTGRLVAIYPATEGISPRQMRGWVATALARTHIPEPLPESIRKTLDLPERKAALVMAHRPESMEQVTAATRRLAFEEFFFLQVGLTAKKRRAAARRTRIRFRPEPGHLERTLRGSLPFLLTGAQERAIADISADLARGVPMHRLMQGDVGCGKTAVALMALLKAVDNGYQGAIMAPTEVLAEQHFQKITGLVTRLGVPVTLLVGGMKGKRQALADIASGRTRVVIGTQALIQEQVTFHKLGLAVVDEQHRFGVRQRATIGAKGDAPHTLIMTATPIPRSLAMTVYGDLDLTVIDELPPGRKPVTTRLFYENRRDRVYEQVAREVRKGHRAFVVFPLVEESEKMDLRSATCAVEELTAGPLAGFSVGLLTGRMNGADKSAVMAAFAKGDIQVLVATTVIEVGVDIPEATLMVIEHAERFGLSQLHQLRGRVGRGDHPGRCILVASPAVSKEGKARLKALVTSHDGFVIAERDLEIRGPGELFGQRQSGLPELKVANIIRDGALLALAREAAARLIDHDPELVRPEHKLLRETVSALWRRHLKWGAVG